LLICFATTYGFNWLKKRAEMPLKDKVRIIKMRNTLVAALLLLLPVVIHAAPEVYQEDVHYKKVNPEQPGAEGKRILVQGFFMYSCGHCNELEPYLDEWLKQKPEDVDFVKVPAVFDQPTIIMYAKVFYALNLIEADAGIHAKIFKAIHEEKNRLRTEAEMDDFLESNGVNMDEFHKAVKSFAILTNMRKASVLAENFDIRGVPALAIDGKYLIPGQDKEIMIGAMDQLIEQVRKAKATDKPGS
jgi:thiol:disulfide interchange protein DsbA